MTESTPDPSWDYAQVWAVLQENKIGLEQLIDYMSKQETATKEADNLIRDRLTNLAMRFQYCRDLMRR
jgi:hypothetical protein